MFRCCMASPLSGILAPVVAETVTGYLFDPFRLDLQTGELWKQDQRLEIRPKVFDLLVFLLQNRGNLLTKEMLLNEVWSDVVVSETSLTRTVADLRDLLDDDADEPRYIQTTPKRGYKFVAPVEEVRTDPTQGTGLSLLHGRKRYALHEGDQLIGRGPEVEIPLFTALTSRHHARVHVSGQFVVLEDLGSMNGTRVNGTRVTGSIELKMGDQIEIGGEELVLWSPLVDTTPAPE